MGGELYQELLLRVTDLEISRAVIPNPWIMLAAMALGGFIVGVIAFKLQSSRHQAEAKLQMAERLEGAYRDFENLRISFNIFFADIRARRPYTVPAYMHPTIVIRARRLEGMLGVDLADYKKKVDDLIVYAGTLPQSAHPLTSEEGKILGAKLKVVLTAIDHIQEHLSNALARS